MLKTYRLYLLPIPKCVLEVLLELRGRYKEVHARLVAVLTGMAVRKHARNVPVRRGIPWL